MNFCQEQKEKDWIEPKREPSKKSIFTLWYLNHKCLCNFMHCKNKWQQLDSSENDYCWEKKIKSNQEKIFLLWYKCPCNFMHCENKRINASNYIHRSIIPNLSCPIIRSRHFFLQTPFLAWFLFHSMIQTMKITKHFLFPAVL